MVGFDPNHSDSIGSVWGLIATHKQTPVTIYFGYFFVSALSFTRLDPVIATVEFSTSFLVYLYP
jgi:hypothetical protein